MSDKAVIADAPVSITVREMIQKLANCENMDANVTVALGVIQHEPINAVSVDYDPDNELLVITGG